MSVHHSTTNPSKSKILFSSSLPIRYGRIIWPKRVSYPAWQNLLKRCPIINLKKRPKKRSLCNCRKFFTTNKHQGCEETIENHIEKITNMPKCLEEPNNRDTKLELITMLKHFLDRKQICQHIEKIIPDKRKKNLIVYSKDSIMKAALSIFLFRQGSGNKFDNDSHDDDEKYSKTNMAKFIDAAENCVPVIKTIETFMQNLDRQSINNLMIAFFKDLQQSKFFKQHPQIMPGDFFLLAADCIHTHTYDQPHHVDANGENDCDCCLKRVYNKGTEKEKTRWLHSVLVFSFIFECGLKLPIYGHPIRAKQVIGFETASEDSHKQECELVALKFTLPIIREAFPRMKIVLLLDGLYANRPVIRLAEEFKYGYIIVKKEECLTLLTKDCNEQAASSNHKKNCVKHCRRINSHKWCIEQKYAWFNSRYLGEGVSTNVLRFLETQTKEGEETKIYQCEWLFSRRLSVKTCELAARQARLRWEIEDLFNSLKNRGSNLKHDYSRNPRSCFNWQGLSLLAFGIFELFRFSGAVTQRGDWPQRTLANKLLSQLLQRPTMEIFSEKCLSTKIQFRYHFVVEMIKSNETPQKEIEEELKTG